MIVFVFFSNFSFKGNYFGIHMIVAFFPCRCFVKKMGFLTQEELVDNLSSFFYMFYNN